MSRLVISDWSAISPFGVERDAFTAGITAGAVAGTVRPDRLEALPGDGLAHEVPDFDIRQVLGSKGTRSMDRLSALSVAGVRQLLDAVPGRRVSATGRRTALVLGTTSGSVQTMVNLTRDTLVQQRPFYVQAAQIPSGIMNSAAAQCAIWHGITGPNATVGGGRAAGLFALRYALRLHAAGRADTVLCGAAEELTHARAWVEHQGRPAGEPSGPLGEGCAVLLLERTEEVDGGLCEVLAVETGIHGGTDVEPALTECLTRTFDRAGVDPGTVWAVSTQAGAGPLGVAERNAVDALLKDERTRRVPTNQPWGEAGAVTVPFQLASVLVEAGRDPAAAGGTALVVAVDQDGVLGCALLRMGTSG
ncbi:beta-ketoacyl synthase N-terminal-like domain-containing protein [Streptomyces profundus]|uniref:beta-ketoacyl synthase N-terminal-like domain-containing protein n=1 Tax=Streptomyces profundus TaxID=2867410 RepID=UPI001D16453C|nr:beta-ketoacyl synthase N-terminal-like domain-containing protein [Streptomyces sp. MA3_2.13]UED85085.1 3-oxoacyl-ACP synthase [Streptomyces sp. MA3_2.13]